MARRRRRRRQRITFQQCVTLLICVGVLCVATYYLLVNYFFVVRSVGVTLPPDSRFTQQQAAQQSGLELGQRLDRVDAAQIAQALEGTGWLYLIDVQLQYPNRVELVVGQRTPAALVSHVSTLVVTDAQGIVIEQVPSEPGYPNCVYVTDLDVRRANPGQLLQSDSHGKVEGLVALLQGFEQVPCQGLISWASLENPRNIKMYSTNHVWVEMGDRSAMPDKLRWTEAALTDLIARETSLGTLNVSSGTHADYLPQK